MGFVQFYEAKMSPNPRPPNRKTQGNNAMTPDEEVRINKRQRRAEVLSWLLAVPIGLLIVAMIVVYKVTFGDGKLFVGEVIYPTIFVAVALSSFFVGRYIENTWSENLGDA